MKAVFFDLDGTLLDTLEDLADAANASLEAEGYPPHPVDAYRFFVGDGMETLLRRAAPEGIAAKDMDRLVECMRGEYSRTWAGKTRPYPGIRDLLAELGRRGIRLAVLSNKPHEFAELTVEHFFPDAPFARVQGSPRGGRAKPDPALAHALARELQVEPGEIMMMGDSSTDMDTAVAAGMLPVGVLWGFRPESELLAHGAKLLLDRPRQLLEFL